MSDNQLILAPADPLAPGVPVAGLRAALHHCGFVGERSTIYGTTHELPGPRFLALLRFAEPPPPGELWAPHTVELRPPSERVEFLGGAGTQDPDCPACGKQLDDWGAALSAWWDGDDGHRWTCPGCGHRCAVWALDWHGSCGFGRQCVVVWHISEGDAAPSDELLTALSSLGAGPWTHFAYRL